MTPPCRAEGGGGCGQEGERDWGGGGRRSAAQVGEGTIRGGQHRRADAWPCLAAGGRGRPPQWGACSTSLLQGMGDQSLSGLCAHSLPPSLRFAGKLLFGHLDWARCTMLTCTVLPHLAGKLLLGHLVRSFLLTLLPAVLGGLDAVEAAREQGGGGGGGGGQAEGVRPRQCSRDGGRRRRRQPPPQATGPAAARRQPQQPQRARRTRRAHR